MKLAIRLTILTILSASSLAHAGPTRCKDELVTGIVRRIDKAFIVVTLGTEEALLPKAAQLAKDHYKVGGTIVAHCDATSLTRTSTRFVELLFAREVPEIVRGVVRIEGTAREAGVRTKISVSSTDANVDPIGAVVGEKGVRVMAVVKELRGEPIDMVPYSAEASSYVTNALAPAEIKRIIIDVENHRMELVIPDGTLAAAIGKSGEKLRLAAQLTGWRLDVHLASKIAALEAKAKRKLAVVVRSAGLPKTLADKIFARAWRTPLELSRAKPEELVKELEIDEAAAAKLLAAAKRHSQ